MSLRNGKTPPIDRGMDVETNESERASSSSVPARPSPYLLAVYPIIIALGSMFYHISPVTRSSSTGHAAPLSPGIVSDQHVETMAHSLNYFARKSNIFNQYFVKIGWFWTTLAYISIALLIQYSNLQQQNRQSRRGNNKQQSPKSRHVLSSAIRYGLITTFWIFITQWFFGPGIIDRSFTLTGGHCEALANEPIHPSGATTAKINRLPSAFSAVACKAAGGHWRGGHDISGHTFMLVLSSAFLLYELVHAENFLPHPRISAEAAANISKSTTEEEKQMLGGWETSTEANLRVYVKWFVYAVIGLDFWMLLMTAVFFHTWLEKASGLFLAGMSLWLVYFLGDFVPAWRQVTG